MKIFSFVRETYCQQLLILTDATVFNTRKTSGFNLCNLHRCSEVDWLQQTVSNCTSPWDRAESSLQGGEKKFPFQVEKLFILSSYIVVTIKTSSYFFSKDNMHYLIEHLFICYTLLFINFTSAKSYSHMSFGHFSFSEVSKIQLFSHHPHPLR